MTKDKAREALRKVGIVGNDIIENGNGLCFLANDSDGFSLWQCLAVVKDNEVVEWKLLDGWLGHQPAFPTLEALLESL